MEAIHKLERLCEFAMQLAQSAEGRQVKGWRGKESSLVFAKICLTCLSFLRLIPYSKYYSPSAGLNIWDLSSAASLCRNIIESYNVLYYVTVDGPQTDEEEYTKTLWNYHAAYEEHEMVRVGLPHSSKRVQIEVRFKKQKKLLEECSHFKKFSNDYQAEILKGKIFKRLSHVEITQRAGISEKYYRAEYKYCSNFSHTSPFSISQLDSFVPNTPKAKQSLRRLVNLTAGYIAFSIRDYLSLFPDLGSSVPKDISTLVSTWEELLKWEKSPRFNQLS